MRNENFNPNCEHCEGTGRIEVDPSCPEEVDTPQYVTCDCCLDWEDFGDLADEAYDQHNN
jgi:RecJ-like exonuclease